MNNVHGIGVLAHWEPAYVCRWQSRALRNLDGIQAAAPAPAADRSRSCHKVEAVHPLALTQWTCVVRRDSFLACVLVCGKHPQVP